MSRPVAVVRPEPGNAATADRATALGMSVVRLPFFAVRRIGWLAPDPADHDALLLTSANAVRHGGPQLERLRGLPVLAVGAATAAAARLAGFDVMLQGDSDAARLIRMADRRGIARALYLAGRERTISAGGPISAVLTVYASDLVSIPADDLARVAGSVVLLHSGRAARRLADLIAPDARANIRIAALSPAIAAAATGGWEAIAIAAAPDDDRLIDAARRVID